MIGPLEAGVPLCQKLFLCVKEKDVLILLVEFAGKFGVGRLLFMEPLLHCCHHHLGIIS